MNLVVRYNSSRRTKLQSLKKYVKNIFFISLLLWMIPLNFFAQTLPEFKVTVYDTSSSGYYFFTPIKKGLGIVKYNPIQMIVDKNGDLVYYKEFPLKSSIGDFKLQKNRLMSYNYMDNYLLMDSTFTIVDSIACKNGIKHDVHDVQILENGNFLLLGYENIEMDLTAYTFFKHTGAAGNSKAIVKCGVIQEQDKNKKVLFEWHSKNYFSFGEVDPRYLDDPQNVDWTHFNAVEMDSDGNILVSSKYFNEITKINKTTGDIMWRLGGKANQFTFVNDSIMFMGQHDIRRNKNGNIRLFDNGCAKSPFHPAIAKEYQINEETKTATLVWNYVYNSSLYSQSMGNIQYYENGNRLINYGQLDGTTTLFTVVKPSNEKVVECSFKDSLRSYRSYHYTSLPWDLHRPQITCRKMNGKYYLDAGSGYASYKWSNGATTQLIPITTTGKYFVLVPKGLGGFLYSEPFLVTAVSKPSKKKK
jgi:Arylsulfotransferase (ASST)